MSQFVVSARKYRPTNFKDVISQSHITTTLKNAIASGQVAHAFLFCGPRGVGKTTCARILAKAMNCLQLTEAIEPCNQCANCLSVINNSSMNVYELDAASNNSVEDIRDLVAQVRYGPQMAKYKIYIIDEVHMLSNAAFNSFLKTLEEPPNYAIFILATTEQHKVLPTILSRCQIFNFNRIKLEDIVWQLKTIAAKASIAYETSALQLIAQKAEGAMRDALSVFDLISTAVGPSATMTYAVARDHLQILDEAYYFRCTQAFLEGNIASLLSLYDTLLQAGYNGHHFVVGLAEHLRNILVCKDPATLPLLAVTDNIRAMYSEYASKCTMSFLLSALARLNKCDIGYKSSQHQRLHVELALIEIAQPKENTEKSSIAMPPQEAKTFTKPSFSAPFKNSIPSSSDNLITQAVASSEPFETLTLPTLESLKATLSTKKDADNNDLKKKVNKKDSIQKPILLEEVEAFFADYTQEVRNNGEIAAYHLMKQPITIQGSVITISLVNAVQKDTLQSLKESLLHALRKKLNHPELIIESVIVEPQASQKPYTDQEKLSYLIKKNAAIGLLQESLMLEVAY